MSLARYVVLVLVLVALGLLTVWQHLDLLSAGYETNNLRSKRAGVEEEVRVLERRIDAMATPATAAAQLGPGGRAAGTAGGGR
jgi:hypothetical protein